MKLKHVIGAIAKDRADCTIFRLTTKVAHTLAHDLNAAGYDVCLTDTYDKDLLIVGCTTLVVLSDDYIVINKKKYKPITLINKLKPKLLSIQTESDSIKRCSYKIVIADKQLMHGRSFTGHTMASAIEKAILYSLKTRSK